MRVTVSSFCRPGVQREREREREEVSGAISGVANIWTTLPTQPGDIDTSAGLSQTLGTQKSKLDNMVVNVNPGKIVGIFNV